MKLLFFPLLVALIAVAVVDSVRIAREHGFSDSASNLHTSAKQRVVCPATAPSLCNSCTCVKIEGNFDFVCPPAQNASDCYTATAGCVCVWLTTYWRFIAVSGVYAASGISPTAQLWSYVPRCARCFFCQNVYCFCRRCSRFSPSSKCFEQVKM